VAQALNNEKPQGPRMEFCKLQRFNNTSEEIRGRL
jgi:hypothetical protein